MLPGRYRDDPAPGRERLHNHDAVLDHARRLAERLDRATEQVLVVGGDCSLLLGVALHLRRRGRFGLVHIDGHTDFRHPAISTECASLAGEDLAAVIGRHWAGIADIDAMAPYVDPRDVVHIGYRPDDAWIEHTQAAGVTTVPAEHARQDPQAAARTALGVVDRSDLDGYWVHLDVDVLDPSFLAAVDTLLVDIVAAGTTPLRDV